MSEPIALCAPEDLTLEALDSIAWDGRALALHPELLARVGENRRSMLRVIETGQQVYGVTTGMEYFAGVRLSEAEQREHQANLLLGRAVGGRPYLTRAEARAVIVVRIAGFLRAVGSDAGIVQLSGGAARGRFRNPGTDGGRYPA